MNRPAYGPIRSRVRRRLCLSAVLSVLMLYSVAGLVAGGPDEMYRLRPFKHTSQPLRPLTAFPLGSMGGHYTYDEVQNHIDSLGAAYPAVCGARFRFAVGYRGGSLWYVRLSDNASVKEEEPGVLYTALHHADEPLGMMQMMYFIYYLAENYGSDPEVTYLLNSRELDFIPIFNPDGYLYNQQLNPNGGGLWRTNRQRYHVTWTDYPFFGIDLDRNYSYRHNTEVLIAGSDHFQGTYAFDARETRGFMAWLKRESNLNIVLNYHGPGRSVVYPWNYSSYEQTKDSVVYARYANEMTQTNGFRFGTNGQMEFEAEDSITLHGYHYLSMGTAEDWLYGEKGILAMKVAVGGRMRWPPRDSIQKMCEETVRLNLFAAWAAGAYPRLTSYRVSNEDGGPYVNSGERGHLVISIENIGRLANAFPLDVTVSTSDTILTIADNEYGFGPIDPFTSVDNASDPIVFQLHPSAKTGDIVELLVRLTFDGYTITDTAEFVVGTPSVLMENDNESMTAWDTTGSSWGLSTDRYAGSFSTTDSPFGVYFNNAKNPIVSTQPVSFSSVVRPWLEFRTKWDIEEDWDFATVSVSTDGGAVWFNVAGDLAEKASGKTGPQSDRSVYGYDGQLSEWTIERIDLRRWEEAANVLIKFELASDGWLVGDGWYVDDVRVLGYVRPAGSAASRAKPYRLMQNFPNPFNPATGISFVIDRPSRVSLTIFNILGQKVRTLVAGQPLPAGQHRYEWNATNDRNVVVSSGLYIYRLETDFGVATRKMLLLK